MRPSLFLFVLFTGSCIAQSTVVDASDREIRPPAKVERVYAAGPPAGLLVFAIAPDKLTGWTRAMRPNEAEFFAQRDLIVDVGSTGATLASLASQVQEQTRIPYGLFDGRIESTPATLRALGKLMGNEGPAEKLAAWYERELADAKQRVATAKEHRSINVEALEVLGARNAAAEVRAGLVSVSLEQVLLWNPEVILTTDPNFWKSVWTDPRWRALKALKAKRVYLSPHLPFGWFD
ncbi:MAG: hypothetical protein ACJ8G5_14570, partial [Burkholderiales bacterium]